MEFNPVPITKGGNVNTEQENVQVDSFTAFKKQCEVELITAGQSPTTVWWLWISCAAQSAAEASEFVKRRNDRLAKHCQRGKGIYHTQIGGQGRTKKPPTAARPQNQLAGVGIARSAIAPGLCDERYQNR